MMAATTMTPLMTSAFMMSQTTLPFFTVPVVNFSATTMPAVTLPLTFGNYITSSPSSSTTIGFVDSAQSTFIPAAEIPSSSDDNTFHGVLSKGMARVFAPERGNVTKSYSPAGLVIKIHADVDFLELVSKAIQNEPAIPNNRLVLDLQNSPSAPDNISEYLIPLKRLADETGITITLKTRVPPYVHEFLPAVIRAEPQEGVAWARGTGKNRIRNPELQKLIRKIISPAPPQTYEDLFQRLLDAGVSPALWELPMSIVSNGGGKPLIGVHMEDLDQTIIDLLQKAPKSHTTKSFRILFKGLPVDIQERSRETFRLWRLNPANANLRFNKLDNNIRNYYSIDAVGKSWKAVAIRTAAGTYKWIWIGSHESYNKFYRKLQKNLQKGVRNI